MPFDAYHRRATPCTPITATGGYLIMHPIELMRKYQWSYLQLAVEFRLSEAAVRRWAFRPEASNYRNPPQMAFALAERIDKELSSLAA